MEKEITEVYCGNGRGKTTLAIGQALRASSQGKSVIIIQFLKGNERRELDFLEELDQLDIKIFRFEKMESCYDQLNEEEQAEEERNILNGLNFARKVIATQECDFLVLPSVANSEAFGLVQLEAMVYGKPVINTSLPTGVPHVSLDGETGLTVPPESETALAKAMQTLISDADLRSRYGAAAKKRVETVFAEDVVMQQVYDVLADSIL